MSNKRKLIMPTEADDAAIQKGIDADPDTYELSEPEFKQLKRIGRPRLATPKVSVTIRYDQDVIDAFKADGDGWQTRMNHALRDWLRTHRV
jgi:uncharacterized protein (DUF4415 family)